MASEKQVLANQRNASKSTGPKTQDGKLQSRRNATRHGLAAAIVVTAIEDSEEFERFEAAITADYQPVSAIEHELVARLVSLLWRLRRATLIETNLFKLQARPARGRMLEAAAASGAASPRMEIFYRMLPSPEVSATAGTTSGVPDLTGNGTSDPNAIVKPASRPNPAAIFMRLCNLSSFPIERINRYETALWRQAAQTLFILDACKKRSP
jgi:hypothetical protein